MSLAGCGGSSGGGGGGSGDDSSAESYPTITKTTSDSDGKATFASTKLSGADSVELTLTAPSGEAAAGMDVYFTEAEDGFVMLVARDPDGAYQTMFLTFDIDDYASASSSVAPSIHLESGQVQDVGIELDEKIGIISLVVVAGVALVATVQGISWSNKFREVAGTIDPYRLANGDPECFSFDTLLDHFELATEAVGLIFWTATTLASAGATTTTTGLYELVLEEMADTIKDELEDMFWDEVMSLALAGAGIEKTTNICWALRLPNASGDAAMNYGKILEMRADQTCTTASDCESMSETAAQDPSALDVDGDGYTPDQGDCNDQNKKIYPGAPEICDSGVIEDCDLSADTVCNVETNGFLRDYIAEGWPDLVDGGSGDVSVVKLSGSFNDDEGEITSVRVYHNNFIDQVFDIGFSWETYLNLVPGLNTIQIIGNSGSYYGAKTMTYTKTSAIDELTVMLFWDECPNLVLYVEEPTDPVTTVSTESPIGEKGSIIVDSLGAGWGPEIYQAETAGTGTYTVYAKYAGNGSCGASGFSTVYKIRILTGYGSKVYTVTLSTVDETSSEYTIRF